jgi:DNA-directed RNA polymerase subunit M
MFCKKCGSVVIPGKERCGNCGELVERMSEIKETIEKKKPQVYSDEEIDVRETTKQECRKCKNQRAYVSRVQLLPADEAETEIYQCTKCSHTWRGTSTL